MCTENSLVDPQPVDLCGVEPGTQLYSSDLLAVNPIHSLPFLLHYREDGLKVTCINGSEAITAYFVARFDQIPDSFTAKAKQKTHLRFYVILSSRYPLSSDSRLFV